MKGTWVITSIGCLVNIFISVSQSNYFATLGWSVAMLAAFVIVINAD